MVDHQQLMRVYGALMWSLGKVFKTPDVSRVYLGSFWDHPLHYDINRRLFQDEQHDLFQDPQALPRNSALRKPNDLIKRARLAKVHAYIIAEVRKQMPSMIGKEKKKKELIQNLDKIYEQLQREHNISPGDFPDVNKMREKLQNQDFSKFNPLKPKLLEVVDGMLATDIARLMAQIPKEEAAAPVGANGAAADPTVRGGAFNQTTEAETPFGFVSLQVRRIRSVGDEDHNVHKIAFLSPCTLISEPNGTGKTMASGALDSRKSCQLNEHVDRFIQQGRAVQMRLCRANDDLAEFPDTGFGAGRARCEQVSEGTDPESGITEEQVAEQKKVYADLQNDMRARNNEEVKIFTQIGEFEKQMKAAEQKLLQKEIQRAEVNYRDAILETTLLQETVDDLNKYRKCLDVSLIQFHTEKMSAVNVIIDELWRKVYNSTDITTIRIRSDAKSESSSKNCAYDYNVMMVQESGAEIEMRGRCSAGQKMPPAHPDRIGRSDRRSVLDDCSR